MPDAVNVHVAITVLRQTARDTWNANALEWSAAIAFHVVLSLFPLVLAGAAMAALVVDAAVVADHLGDLVEGVFPSAGIDVDGLIARAVAERRQIGVAAVLLWLVSGRRILGTLVTALDRVSDVDQRQESLPRRAWVEVMLLAGIGLLFLAALAGRGLFNLIWGRIWPGADASPIGWAAGAIVHAALLMLAFITLYAVVPRGERRWQAVLIGAAVASALYLAARGVFVAFSGIIWSSFGLVYGPLAMAAVLLTWAWIVGFVILFGASLASHVKVMILEGAGIQETERRHVAHKQR